MNGKKAKLLRKLAKMNVEDKTQDFKKHLDMTRQKEFRMPDGKIKTVGIEYTRLDPSCAAYIYRQMKHTYHEMKPFYKGMKSQTVNPPTNENHTDI